MQPKNNTSVSVVILGGVSSEFDKVVIWRHNMSLSTRNLAGLPWIEELRRICQSLAMLDAIISPDWESRYFSFNSKWAPSEMMASMRNGCGDDYFILFTQYGAIIKGFWHESPLSPYGNGGKVWDGILTEAPQEFAGFLAEPAFSINDTTFVSGG